MRLLNIEYWCGHNKNNILILSIEVKNDGMLVGLRSDKMLQRDIDIIKNNSNNLSSMSTSNLYDWLQNKTTTFNSALVRIKNGRYNIIGEYSV